MTREVPRELVAGVVWDEAAEASFQAMVKDFEAKGYSLSLAEQEARWVVEIKLCQRFTRSQLERAASCRCDREKRELMSEWRSAYGLERADSLARMAKGGKALEIARKWKP